MGRKRIQSSRFRYQGRGHYDENLLALAGGVGEAIATNLQFKDMEDGPNQLQHGSPRHETGFVKPLARHNFTPSVCPCALKPAPAMAASSSRGTL